MTTNKTIKVEISKDMLGQWGAYSEGGLLASGNTFATMTQNLYDLLYHSGQEKADVDGKTIDVAAALLEQMQRLWPDFKASELPQRRSAK